MVITTGLYKQSAAKLYKFFLNVAEKKRVYLSDLIWPSIDLTYYSNPLNKFNIYKFIKEIFKPFKTFYQPHLRLHKLFLKN